MATKPSNCVNSIRDKLVMTPIIDFSVADADPIEFVDPDTPYELVSLEVVMTTAYIGSEEVPVNAGISGDETKLIAAASLGADAIGVGDRAGPISPDDPEVVRLEAGEALTLGHDQAGSQTGEGRIIARLRPYDVQNFSTKRPQAAQSPT